MKNIIYAIIVMCTMCISCAPGPYVAITGCLLRSLSSTTSMTINTINGGKAGGDISSLMPQNSQWLEEYGIVDLQTYMTLQKDEYTKGKDGYYAYDVAFEYIYGRLTKVKITSNGVIAGRAAGEDLTDLFKIRFEGPLYSFPDGKFISFDANAYYQFNEIIDGNYFFSRVFNMWFNLSKMDDEEAQFTITLTLNDGEQDKTITSNCTFEK